MIAPWSEPEHLHPGRPGEMRKEGRYLLMWLWLEVIGFSAPGPTSDQKTITKSIIGRFRGVDYQWNCGREVDAIAQNKSEERDNSRNKTIRS